MHAASVNDEGIMTADQFSVAATGHGLLSYKPSKAKGGAAGSTDKRTSSLIQALLMESAANAGQRFTVLQSAWNTHAPTVEKAVDHAKTHVLPAPGEHRTFSLPSCDSFKVHAHFVLCRRVTNGQGRCRQRHQRD